jgi:hypothetical protein
MKKHFQTTGQLINVITGAEPGLTELDNQHNPPRWSFRFSIVRNFADCLKHVIVKTNSRGPKFCQHQQNLELWYL